MENQPQLTVMVIDDDLASAFLTSCQLEDSDLFANPLVFTEPNQALQYFQVPGPAPVAKESPPLPQVVLLDVNMPTKDGFEFLEELFQLRPEVKASATLCIFTISQHSRDRQKAQALGVDLFLEKPLTEQHFQLIRQVVALKRGTSESGRT